MHATVAKGGGVRLDIKGWLPDAGKTATGRVLA